MTEYLISDGMSMGTVWMTCVRRPSGSLRRIKSKYLPLRESKDEAEQDLLFWLWERAFHDLAPSHTERLRAMDSLNVYLGAHPEAKRWMFKPVE